MEFLRNNWKVLAAIIYLSICVFDFVLVPLILVYFEQKTAKDIFEVMNTLKELDVDHRDILAFIDANYRTIGSQWIPFTLRSAGLFHISFGAILTGTVLKK